MPPPGSAADVGGSVPRGLPPHIEAGLAMLDYRDAEQQQAGAPGGALEADPGAVMRHDPAASAALQQAAARNDLLLPMDAQAALHGSGEPIGAEAPQPSALCGTVPMPDASFATQPCNASMLPAGSTLPACLEAKLAMLRYG